MRDNINMENLSPVFRDNAAVLGPAHLCMNECTMSLWRRQKHVP